MFEMARLKVPVISIVIGFIGVNDVSAAEVKYRSISQAVNEDFVINLNKKVRSVAISDIVFSPSVKGKWSVVSQGAIRPDKLVFKPANGFQVKTKYKISNIKVDRLIFGSENLGTIDFTTEVAEGIEDYGTILLEDDSVIPADYCFSFSLRNARNLVLQTYPNIELVQNKTEGNIYKWSTKDYLPQGQKIKISLIDKDANKTLVSKNLTVAAEPQINLNKTTHFIPGDKLEIAFSEPLKNPTLDAIVFNLDGDGSWASDKVYVFSPKNLVAGGRYTFKIKSGLRSEKGGILSKDYDGEFFSTGSVEVIGSSPSGNELSQSSQLLTFQFDQPVDKDSVMQRFSVNYGTITSSYWQDQKLLVKLENIGYQKKVVASIGAGVKNLGFGLPSIEAFYASFTTEAREIKHAVPFYRQQHSATCAVASLKMLLAYRGVLASEEDIIYKIGYDPRAIDKSANPAKWDDPDQMFVGFMDGTNADTAAGPDAGPLARVASSYGRKASMSTGIGIDWVATQIQQGNPVIVFGASSATSGYNTWVTPGGKTVTMSKSSHAFVVVGVKGDPGSLIGFWVNNPSKTSIQFWSASKLQESINLDVYQQAVVVE
jgi:uncharacterized protein YvpB